MSAPFSCPPPPAGLPGPSRLPNVGTTIFTVMSQLAAEHGAVNLGQGFPDFDCSPELQDLVQQEMAAGFNQYAPMPGDPGLRQAVSDKILARDGIRYDAANEITVTAGATQALLDVILATVRPGDEVILLEPTYDSYAPAVELAGGRPVGVPLDAALGFCVDWDRVKDAITPRTRLLVVNNPHNPTGSCWGEGDLARLREIALGSGLLLLSDEVYEHIVFDGQPHRSVSSDPELARRAFVVSSFGKTFHCTGWKVGYCCAPAALMAEFRKVHQFDVFTVNHPVQRALARYLAQPAHYLGLADFYQERRDRFVAGLARTRFRALPCAGTYFVLAAYDAISDEPDTRFASRLLVEHGVASIPLSPFYLDPEAAARSLRLVRFCFGKRVDTLDAALERLQRV